VSKRIYRTVPVQQIEVEMLIRACEGEKRVVLGCDAAKATWRGAFMTASSKLIAIMSWDLLETALVLRLLCALRAAGIKVEVVAEPTGTYADAFAGQVTASELEMYSVSSKHTHDYAELYDGVPSQHDSKDAAVVAKVHLERRKATRWPRPSEAQRDLRALCARVDWLKQEQQSDESRAEALLSRHWPEVLRELGLDSFSLAWLLSECGSPAAVRVDRERVRQTLAKRTRGMLKPEKLERILDSADKTLGVPATTGETELLRALGKRMLERREETREAEGRVREATRAMPMVRSLEPLLGRITAAIIVAYVGDPRSYSSPRALLKQIGLNLKEHSSGTHKGQVSITKRGSGVVRRWLYLAALRLIKSDEIARAWVERKAVQVGEDRLKLKGIVALMRKLVTVLRHLASGAVFDSAKLFDVEHLKRVHALPANFTAASHDRR
jgi:transposase